MEGDTLAPLAAAAALGSINYLHSIFQRSKFKMVSSEEVTYEYSPVGCEVMLLSSVGVVMAQDRTDRRTMVSEGKDGENFEVLRDS